MNHHFALKCPTVPLLSLVLLFSSTVDTLVDSNIMDQHHAGIGIQNEHLQVKKSKLQKLQRQWTELGYRLIQSISSSLDTLYLPITPLTTLNLCYWSMSLQVCIPSSGVITQDYASCHTDQFCIPFNHLKLDKHFVCVSSCCDSWNTKLLIVKLFFCSRRELFNRQSI